MPVLMGKAVFLSAVVAVFLALGISESAEHALVEDEGGLLLAELDMRRADSARRAVSGYLREERIDTPQRVLQYLPFGLLHFLTVPFPWQIGGLRQNLVIPENAFWLLLYPLIAVGIIRAFRVNSSGTMFLLLMTGGMSLIYALISGNVGVAYRMRAQVWLLWAPFAAWGWEVWRARRRRVTEARRSARLAVRRRRVAALSPR